MGGIHICIYGHPKVTHCMLPQSGYVYSKVANKYNTDTHTPPAVCTSDPKPSANVEEDISNMF
jgi:hypothetical protein